MCLGRALQFVERLVVLPFLGCEVRGQLHFDARVEISPVVWLADGRHAVALEPEHLAVLRQRRDSQPRRLAGERLNVRLTTEYAVVTGTGTVTYRSRPLRSNCACGASLTRR